MAPSSQNRKLGVPGSPMGQQQVLTRALGLMLGSARNMTGCGVAGRAGTAGRASAAEGAAATGGVGL